MGRKFESYRRSQKAGFWTVVKGIWTIVKTLYFCHFSRLWENRYLSGYFHDCSNMFHTTVQRLYTISKIKGEFTLIFLWELYTFWGNNGIIENSNWKWDKSMENQLSYIMISAGFIVGVCALLTPIITAKQIEEASKRFNNRKNLY